MTYFILVCNDNELDSTYNVLFDMYLLKWQMIMGDFFVAFESDFCIYSFANSLQGC